MIIKTVLFLTVVLNIGKYESVYCSRLLDSYLNIEVEDFESFNMMCHHAIYTIIYTRTYNIEKEWIKLPMKSRIKRIHNYIIRLHRIWYNGDNSKLMYIHDDAWKFYKYFVDWTVNQNDENMSCIRDCCETLIFVIEDNNSDTVVEEFEYCEKRLIELTKKSEDEILAEELKKVFYNEGQKIYDMNNANENMEFPVLIEYGLILLLLKEGEINDFIRSRDEKEKKIFVVDMMKEALVNTFFTIMIILKEFGSFTAEQFKCIEYKDDESIVILIILKSIFIKIIDATEAVFDIQEDRKNYSGILQYRLDGIMASKTIDAAKAAMKKKAKISIIDPETLQLYPDLNEEYNTYMDMVKATLNQICPELVTKKHKRDKTHLNEEIKIRFPGRLTVDNSIRVSLLSHFPVTASDLPDEPFMKELIKDNNSKTKLLLELYAWMINIKEYADIMNDAMLPEDQIQDNTMDQNQRFMDDREFLKEFKCT